MRGVRRRVLRSGGWLPANSPQSLHQQVHDNLCRLGSTCSTWSTSGPPPGSTTAWWLRARSRPVRGAGRTAV